MDNMKPQLPRQQFAIQASDSSLSEERYDTRQQVLLASTKLPGNPVWLRRDGVVQPLHRK